MTGEELQAELIRRKIHLPIIFLTAYGDVPTSVRAIKLGAIDFLTKPVSSKLLIERIQMVLQQESQKHNHSQLIKQEICGRLNGLTSRESEVILLVVAGHSNKEIARQLGISYRTVEIRRSRVMEKTGATNLLELAHTYEACGLPSRRLSENSDRSEDEAG